MRLAKRADRLPSGVAGVLVGVCCASVIAACASSRSKAMAGGAPMQNPAVEPPMTPARAPIDDEFRKLEAARERMGLPAPVAPLAGSPTPMTDMAVGPTSANDPTCHPGATDACHDTCTLADSICDSAAHICDLAKQLPGDTWAEGKCSSGQATCTTAHARCCGCQ